MGSLNGKAGLAATTIDRGCSRAPTTIDVVGRAGHEPCLERSEIWAYARDDRPWGCNDPPMVAYVYAPDRKAERPEAHLADFAGILQVDGYGGYAALTRRRQQVRLAFCWAHVRRKFFELADKSPVATEVLRRIALPYAIEDEVRGSSAPERRALRAERSRAIVDDLRDYLSARLRQVSAKSKLAEAIRYALSRRGRPITVPRRRPRRSRLQHGGAVDQADRPQPQKCFVRRL